MSFDLKLWELTPQKWPCLASLWFFLTQPECQECLEHLILQICDPQPFWAQGMVSWKTHSVDREVGGGFRITQARYFHCVLYFSHYYISTLRSSGTLGSWRLGTLFQIKGMEHTLRKGYCSWRMRCPFQRSITEHGSKGMVTSEQDTSRPSGPTLPPQEPVSSQGLSGL